MPQGNCMIKSLQRKTRSASREDWLRSTRYTALSCPSCRRLAIHAYLVFLYERGVSSDSSCNRPDQCPYIIDFVNPPISVGHESVHHFNTLKTSVGSLKLLSPTDC